MEAYIKIVLIPKKEYFSTIDKFVTACERNDKSVAESVLGEISENLSRNIQFLIQWSSGSLYECEIKKIDGSLVIDFTLGSRGLDFTLLFIDLIGPYCKSAEAIYSDDDDADEQCSRKINFKKNKVYLNGRLSKAIGVLRVDLERFSRKPVLSKEELERLPEVYRSKDVTKEIAAYGLTAIIVACAESSQHLREFCLLYRQAAESTVFLEMASSLGVEKKLELEDIYNNYYPTRRFTRLLELGENCFVFQCVAYGVGGEEFAHKSVDFFKLTDKDWVEKDFGFWQQDLSEQAVSWSAIVGKNQDQEKFLKAKMFFSKIDGVTRRENLEPKLSILGDKVIERLREKVAQNVCVCGVDVFDPELYKWEFAYKVPYEVEGKCSQIILVVWEQNKEMKEKMEFLKEIMNETDFKVYFWEGPNTYYFPDK